MALAQERASERIAAGAPTVKRWGGYILTLVGLWFVALAIFADPFARLLPV